MYYIFKKDSKAKTPVSYLKAHSDAELRLILKRTAGDTLFVYNGQNDEISIKSTFYDLLECSYFLYASAGIFKPISTLKPI